MIKKHNFLRLAAAIGITASACFLAPAGNVNANDSVDIKAAFSDTAFQEYVEDNFDKDKNGMLSSAETGNVTAIDCSGLGISSLDGIGYFPNLISLDCSNNDISYIDTRELSGLSYFTCSYNCLTSLDVTCMTNLLSLKCIHNNISFLDLSSCKRLKIADYSYNRVAYLEKGENRNLFIFNDCNIISASGSDGGITVTWNKMRSKLYDEGGNPLDVDGYLVYRKAPWENWVCVARVEGAETLSLFDPTTSVGVEYTYTVRPFSYGGNEVWGDYNEAGVSSVMNGWVQDSRGWWYSTGNGTYPVSRWKQISGRWYYFDENGYSVTGWKKLSGSWYYFDESCSCVTGWNKIDGYWYYFGINGKMWHDCWVGDYYLQSDGSMAEYQWIFYNGSYYYTGCNGHIVYGWNQIDGEWYFFGTSGSMYCNCWACLDDKWYYFDSTGKMVRDCWLGGYYFNSDGTLA